MEIACFVVVVEGPDEYPASEGSAEELARLEMRVASDVEHRLSVALSDDLPDGFKATVTRED